MINSTWRAAPWADLLYACDWRWFRVEGPAPEEFKGIRVQGHIGPREHLEPGCIHGGVKAGLGTMQLKGPYIGAGGNSGFQLINYLARCGVNRMILTGYDMGRTGGASHWHGDHSKGLTNPEDGFLRRCAQTLDHQRHALDAAGIRVINASRHSNLKAYERMAIEDALDAIC